jgi:hypothetical protein
MADVVKFPPRGPAGEAELALPRQERLRLSLRSMLDDFDDDPPEIASHILVLGALLYDATIGSPGLAADHLEGVARRLREPDQSPDGAA